MLGQEDNQFIKSLEQEYTCSISKLPMTDPVVAADGQTYERQAINEWFKENTKSPNTGLQLPNTDLVPNIVLKNVIDKINTELYGFLGKQQGLKTYISQLKEEIDYLKVELQHEKQRNDEQIEKEERQFKSRKIEKRRHQDKDQQLKVIRDQKNTFQKQLLELRTKEQQQNREIRILKEQLSNIKEKFTEISKLKKTFQEKSIKYNRNRSMCMSKVRHSFISNLVFIGHLLQSIQDAKKIIDPQIQQQQKRQKGTQESINVQREHEQERRNFKKLVRDQVIKQIEHGITERVCGLRKQMQEEDELENETDPQIRRLIIRRRIRQRQGRGYLPHPGDTVNANEVFTRGLSNNRNVPPQIREILRRRAQRTGVPLQSESLSNPQPLSEAQPQPQTQPQPTTQIEQQSQLPAQTLQSQAQSQPQAQSQYRTQLPTQLQRIREEPQFMQNMISKKQGLVKQLDSIKWLMSKRDYRRFPTFYDYQFIRQHEDNDVYWFGVRIRVLESRIPFLEYLPHCWNHVRILDLSACNIDDTLWERFIESRQNFKQLTYIDLDRNTITNVQERQITGFSELKNFIITNNRLSTTALDMLRLLRGKRPDLKIDFDDIVEPNMPIEDNEEFF